MSAVTVDDEPDNYFHIHYKILAIFGIGIKEFKRPIVRKIYQAYAIIVITLFLHFYAIAEGIAAVQTWKDLTTATFAFSYFLTHSLGCVKLTLVLFTRKDIHNYCQWIKSGVFLPDLNRSGVKEFEFVSTAITTCLYQMYFFYVFVVLIVGPRVMIVITDPGYHEEIFDAGRNETTFRRIRPLPYSSWFPFDTTETPYYELAVAYQTLCAVFFGFVVGGIDSLICGILCHIKAQFLILKNCLDTFLERAAFLMEKDGISIDMKKYTEFKTTKNGTTVIEKIPNDIQRYVDICVIDCVKHHHKIIELARGAEKTFNYLMLAQFLFSLLLICCQLFQLSLYEVASLKFLSMLSYLILMLFQILVFCWHGNETILQSADVMDAVFNSNWLVTNVSTQKSLLLMMMRAYRPIKLTAGKFAFLSLETFMSIVRGSGSYFMMLRKFNIAREM